MDNDFYEQYAKPPKKNSTLMICIICCTILCILTVIISLCIVNKNNKNLETQNAIEKIDRLIEEIYRVEDCFGNDYLIAKDKLEEVKTLIADNYIKGLTVSKYNDANSYISDLKILSELENLDFSKDPESFAREADKLIAKITNTKVQEKLERSVVYPNLTGCIKKVILGKAFFTAQEYFSKTYPDRHWGHITEITPNSSISSEYSLYNGDYITNVNANSLITYAYNAKDGSKFQRTNTKMLVSTLDKIKANGGYAIIVNYHGENPDSLALGAIFWYVGVDVSFDIYNDSIKYNITRYVDGEPETYNGLSLDEALDFTMLIPS